MLHRDKTEAIVIAAVNTRAHATVDVVADVCGCIITPTPYVRDIGVWLDSAMSMANNVCCQLRSIARIRCSITTSACRTIVHALVMGRLDYCNAILYGLPDVQLHRLQLVQNAAARLITGTHRREHIARCCLLYTRCLSVKGFNLNYYCWCIDAHISSPLLI